MCRNTFLIVVSYSLLSLLFFVYFGGMTQHKQKLFL